MPSHCLAVAVTSIRPSILAFLVRTFLDHHGKLRFEAIEVCSFASMMNGFT
jgi:hypothetical protein